jgi:hypothetical protein
MSGSFYSSQGRQTSFPDHNATLIDDLIACVPGLATFEVCAALDVRPLLTSATPLDGDCAPLPSRAMLAARGGRLCSSSDVADSWKHIRAERAASAGRACAQHRCRAGDRLASSSVGERASAGPVNAFRSSSGAACGRSSYGLCGAAEQRIHHASWRARRRSLGESGCARCTGAISHRCGGSSSGLKLTRMGLIHTHRCCTKRKGVSGTYRP